jgi:hypothetical protein
VVNLTEGKEPREVNEEKLTDEELIDIEANEEAAQDYIRIIEEEVYEDDLFDWFLN